jgi:ribosomal RNA-processing protein 9
MPDSFFSGPARKRKRENKASSASKGKRKGPAVSKPKRRRQPASSEESDDLDSGVGSQEDAQAIEDVSSDEAEDETAAQKRLRLAEMYLESLQDEAAAEGGFDAKDLDRDIIAERLQSDVVSPLFFILFFATRWLKDIRLAQLVHSGKIHLFVSDGVGHFFYW